METIKKEVEYVQSQQQKHQNKVTDVDLVLFLLTLNTFQTFS